MNQKNRNDTPRGRRLRRIAKHYDEQIATRIRARRRELKLTTLGVGEALGVSFQQIQKYEKGTNRIPSGRLIMLMRLLRMEPSDVLNPIRCSECASDCRDSTRNGTGQRE